MSKKHKQMDKPFQIWNGRRFLKSKFIEPDLIDVASLIDSTLFYPENEEILRRFV